MHSAAVESRRGSGWRLGCLCLLLIPLGLGGSILYQAIRWKYYHDEDLLQWNLDRLKKEKTGHFSLICTRNTDWVVEQVRGMPEIEHVSMEREHITVAGMKHLGTLPNLKSMHVYYGGPGICDEGILELRNCSKLESLILLNAPITEEGIAALQRYLPNVRVATKDER
jgi:hypothetical protein